MLYKTIWRGQRVAVVTSANLGVSALHGVRLLTTQHPSPHAKKQTTKPHTIDPRWLTTMKKRIGKCITFGLKPSQIEEAGILLHQLAKNWRELVAGSEGYITDKSIRGLFRHNVVWGEMDVMGHVNNVTYVRYAETARVNFLRNFGLHVDPAHKEEWINLVNSSGLGVILRSIKVDYKFPMIWPDKITVYHKLAHDPTTSLSSCAFELQVMILSEARQRPAARCYEDIVTYDYRLAQKTQGLPTFMRDHFKALWEKQQLAKKFWQQRIVEIENGVRKLEFESWDRVDAVEDIGSAAGL